MKPHDYLPRILVLLLVPLMSAATGPDTYHNDFEKAKPGKLPADFMVLDGSFAVRQIDGNKCLELAPDPIGMFGVLFGPAGSAAVDVKARVWSKPTGMRFPEFGVGAGDAGGWKLWLVPGQHALELRQADETKATTHFDWPAGKWTWLRLRVRPDKSGGWVIEGKAWPQDGKEPPAWQITATDKEPPPAGRASLWGVPFSEQPIRFDDLKMGAADGPTR